MVKLLDNIYELLNEYIYPTDIYSNVLIDKKSNPKLIDLDDNWLLIKNKKDKSPFGIMKTQWLAFMAGIIWLAAGFNVCRIGVEAWRALTATTAGMVLGSLATLVLFSVMFVKMLFKNVRRIGRIYPAHRRIWHLMPLRSYLVMAVMITLGIILRSCQAVPRTFIASFYVGLGGALMLAGAVYLSALFCPKDL